MSYTERRKGHGYCGTIRRAKKVHAKRSSWAKHIDSKLKAPKAKDVDGAVKLTAPKKNTWRKIFSKIFCEKPSPNCFSLFIKEFWFFQLFIKEVKS